MKLFKITLFRLLSSKMRLLIIFLGPILFISSFVLSISDSVKVGVIDEDHSYFSKELIRGLETDYQVTLLEKDQLITRVAEFQDVMVLEIPKGFEKELVNYQTKSLVNTYFAQASVESELVSEKANGLINVLGNLVVQSQGDMEKTKSLYQAYDTNSLGILKGGESVESQRLPSAMGFLMQFILYMAIATTGLLLEDKENGTFARNLYAPFKLSRYLFESLLAFSVVGFIQISVVFAFTVISLNYSYGALNMKVVTICYGLMLLFSFVAITLGLLIVNLVKKPMIAYTLMGVLTTPLVMLGGCYFEKSLMPKPMVIVGYFLPTTWGMDSIYKAINTGSFASVLPESFVLVLFALVFFFGGVLKKVDISK